MKKVTLLLCLMSVLACKLQEHSWTLVENDKYAHWIDFTTVKHYPHKPHTKGAWFKSAYGNKGDMLISFIWIDCDSDRHREGIQESYIENEDGQRQYTDPNQDTITWLDSEGIEGDEFAWKPLCGEV